MNPNWFLNQILNAPMIQNNPIMSNAVKMYRNGDSQGLKNLCENVCKERGIDINQISNQIMGQFR